MTVGIGIVGLGVMGKIHARVATELDGAELVGLCDADAEVLKEQEARFDVAAVADLEEMLALDGLDAVVVATPTKTHPVVARRVIDAGKHLLVEKPLADDVEDAQGIVDAAEAAGVRLAVGHVERHNPVVGAVANALDAGAFGDLLGLSARRVSSFPDRIRDVGVIMDLGIHDIDVMQSLAPSPVTAVYARAGTRQAKGGLFDHAQVMLAFEDDVTGSLETNWLTPRKIRTLSLTCDEAYVELDYVDQAATVSTPRAGGTDEADRSDDSFEARDLDVEQAEPLKRELADLCLAITEGRRPLAAGTDGVAAVRVAEAARRSAREGSVVTVQEGG